MLSRPNLQHQELGFSLHIVLRGTACHDSHSFACTHITTKQAVLLLPGHSASPDTGLLIFASQRCCLCCSRRLLGLVLRTTPTPALPAVAECKVGLLSGAGALDGRRCSTCKQQRSIWWARGVVQPAMLSSALTNKQMRHAMFSCFI
jgi:hypothetical protein